jgi:hypothetical protein
VLAFVLDLLGLELRRAAVSSPGVVTHASLLLTEAEQRAFAAAPPAVLGEAPARGAPLKDP